MSEFGRLCRFGALSLALPAILGPPAARAEPAPPFAELLRQSGDAAPSLAESEAEVRAARGEAEQAGVRPNPTISLDVENVTGSAAYRGINPRQATLGASQTLELGGKRSARMEAGRAGVEAAEAQRRQAGADFAYRLAVAYAEAETAQARAELLNQDVERASEDLRAARSLVDAGREADLRALQAQAAVSAAQAELQAARARSRESLARLSALVGAPATYTSVGASLLGKAAALKPPVEPPPLNPPAVAAATAQRDAAAKRVNVERARGTPDVTVSVGARRVEGSGTTALVGGLSAPLPLFDRNRGGVSAALAQRDAAEARLRAARLDAEADWIAAVARADASQAGLQAADAGEAASAEAYRLARIGYDAGRTPLAELLAARRALTEAQQRALDARSQRILAEAALARLAGRSPFGDAQ